MSKKTITLTKRPPVSIDEANWPVIASYSDKAFEGQYEFQSFRTSKWTAVIRQHEDGRALCYAIYSYDSAHQGERCYSVRHGKLLPPESTVQEIVEAMTDVCHDMRYAEHHGEDANRWDEMLRDVIADLPAEELT